MKKYSRNLLSALMALLIAVSAVSGIGFSAAELNNAENVAEEATEPVAVVDNEALVSTGAEPENIVSTEAPAASTEAPVPPTVGKVTNFERTTYESDLIKMTWDAVPDVEGYYVYICNADKSSTYKKIATVKGTSVTVKNLIQATQYHFRICAYTTFNGQIIEGPLTTKKTATQPSALTGLTKWRSSDVLEMDWNRNSNATGYMIYRTESGGKEVLYKTITSNKTTSFTDKNVKKGRTYKYRVKSYRKLYGDVTYSSSSSAITFIAGLCGPNYSINSRCQRVNLTWNANPYATHYEIYYSTSSDNSTFKKLYTTTRLYYNTTKLTAGKTYYFRVRPIYQKGSTTITGTSNKKSVKVSHTAYGKSVGSTYIEICIEQQHMWVYKNGKQIASTDVVTGNKGNNDTPKGYYHVQSKSRGIYLTGPGYSSYVNYWMAFIGSSYGIHDASWRSSYGYPIYKGNGSHGCVNTPKSSMSTIYNNIPSGTPVIIY